MQRPRPISIGMSFEAAIGRIDQILQFQQQVQNPAGVSSSAASGGAAISPGSGSTTTSANFADMLAGAQEASDAAAVTDLDSADTDGDGLASATDPLASLASLGSLALSGITSPSTTEGVDGGAATSAPGQAVQAMVDEANSLVGKPYVWGGGHGGWGPQAGYDCSGFVSAVLHAGGYLASPEDTATLPTAPGIEAGPGQYVTIYDRNESGQQGHVIIDIGGQFYESGGESGTWGGGGGVEKIGTPSAAYLATFNDVLHPEGL